MDKISIYCDESSHNNSKQGIMALGAIYCRTIDRRKLFKQIREIKEKHNLSPQYEAKWTKISKNKVDFYKELVDFFFSMSYLNFRVITIDKSQIDHSLFNQDHDDWYYKMMFLLVRGIILPNKNYGIYLDKKDERSSKKNKKLKEYLSRTFSNDNLLIQSVRSEEVELMQICDILMGATAYANRFEYNSVAKKEIIDYISSKGINLHKTTLESDRKFNILCWRGRV